MAAKVKRERMPSAQRVGKLIFSSFSDVALGKRLNEIRIWSVWQNAVGKQIAGVARPIKIVNGILTVGVTSSPWMQQLQFLKIEIRDRINETVEADLVKDIFLKSVSIKKGEAQQDDSEEILFEEISDSKRKKIDQLSESITDAELKAGIVNLLEISARRKVD